MVPIKSSALCPKRPPVTIGLLVVNCLVFLFELSLDPEVLDQFVRTYGLIPARF